MICGLCHLIGIAHNTLRNQIYKIGLFQTMLVGGTLCVNEVFDLEKLIPNVNKSLLGDAIISFATTIPVDNLFNFLDDLLDNFNLNNLFSNDWLFNDFFNFLDSIFVDYNLFFYLLNTSVNDRNLDVLFNLLDSCNWHFYLHGL